MSIDNQIIEFLKGNDYLPMKQHEIANALGIYEKKQRNIFRRTLYDLEERGIIQRLRKNRFSLPNSLNYISGIIKFLPKGGGILLPSDEKDEEVYINDKNLSTALPNDKVTAELFYGKRINRNSTNRIEGKIIDIIKRNKVNFVGTLKHGKYITYAIIDDHLINQNVIITEETLINHNHKVLIKIDDWTDPQKNITGSIVKDLGHKSNLGIEITSMLNNEGINEEFSQEILNDVNKIDIDIKKEIKNRKDLRKLTSFTIDPDTAKDFDDALSIEKHPNDGWVISVHIADVSYFVGHNSSIDKEALKRGNSIYLPDRVIMMLPKELTTIICSLTPNEDHLTHTVEMHINNDGELLSFSTYEAVINSKCRLTYQQVQKFIDKKSDHNIPINISKKINQLYPLIKKVRKKRIEAGSLELNTPDIDIKLDDAGNVESITTRSSAKEAYQMVEDCMLLANKVVANILFNSKKPSIYRIHESPDEEQWNKMALELDTLGIPYFPSSRKEINQIFEFIKGKHNEYATLLSILRNFKRAEYSSKCSEHFGLAFEKYTHFTSPIRRYPDLVVHRLLKAIEKNMINKLSLDEISYIADHCSKTEKKADELERKSIEKKRIDYYYNQLKNGKNPPLVGIITSIKKNGIIIEIPSTLQRGMILYSTISNSWLRPNQNNTSVINDSNKIIFTLGKVVEVIISKVDVDRKLIDFVLCKNEQSKKNKIKKIPNLKTGKLKIKKRTRRKKN